MRKNSLSGRPASRSSDAMLGSRVRRHLDVERVVPVEADPRLGRVVEQLAPAEADEQHEAGGGADHAPSAARACLTTASKLDMSFTAMSARTLRLSSMLASFRP